MNEALNEPDDPVSTLPTAAHDPINRPAHYTFSDIEPIDVVETWGLGFHLGNVLKYLARAGRKDPQLQDLRKAQWYLNREIQRLSQQQNVHPNGKWK